MSERLLPGANPIQQSGINLELIGIKEFRWIPQQRDFLSSPETSHTEFCQDFLFPNCRTGSELRDLRSRWAGRGLRGPHVGCRVPPTHVLPCQVGRSAAFTLEVVFFFTKCPNSS